jgi:hypothetical protein
MNKINTPTSQWQYSNKGAKKFPICLLKYFLYLFLSPLFVSLEFMSQFAQTKNIASIKIGVLLMMICVSIALIWLLKKRSLQTNSSKLN